MDNVLQSPQQDVIPFQILGGEAQIVQVLITPNENNNCAVFSFILLRCYFIVVGLIVRLC